MAVTTDRLKKVNSASQGFIPRLALTLGDPAGIGPEIVLKALADRHSIDRCSVVVVGDRRVLEANYEHLRDRVREPLAEPDAIELLDCQTGFEPSWGEGTAASGEASFRYLSTAIDRTLAGEFDGIVTGPIAKFAWKAAGHHFPGQTEVLARAAKNDRFGMLFAARSPLTQWQAIVLLATTHIPLRQVPEQLTPESIETKLELLAETLKQDFAIESPRIAVAGLNPHSGEGGQLGREEVEWLAETIAACPYARGPIPPDTMWVEPGRAWYETGQSRDDAYLALYHDQGLIPLKLMAFDRAVNVTIGLPFVRTSPDHGTAFDIAGQGLATASSYQAAIELAADIATRRHVSTAQITSQ